MRIYLESTIPSYLVARRSRDLRLAADQESTEERRIQPACRACGFACPVICSPAGLLEA